MAHVFITSPGWSGRSGYATRRPAPLAGSTCSPMGGAAQAFLVGPLVAQVRAAPMLTDFQATRYGVIEDLTAVTRGPIDAYGGGA